MSLGSPYSYGLFCTNKLLYVSQFFLNNLKYKKKILIDFHIKTLVRNYWYHRCSQRLLKFQQDAMVEALMFFLIVAWCKFYRIKTAQVLSIQWRSWNEGGCRFLYKIQFPHIFLGSNVISLGFNVCVVKCYTGDSSIPRPAGGRLKFQFLFYRENESIKYEILKRIETLLQVFSNSKKHGFRSRLHI